MDFLIVIKFGSSTMITFSQGDAAKIKSKQFSEFDSRISSYMRTLQIFIKKLN